MSFLRKSTPGVIFFSSMKAALTGGETPLCDFTTVAKELPEGTRKLFEKKGIIIVRNYVGPKEWSVDPWKLKKWDDIFKTTDHEKVKVICEKDELVPKWYENDALQLTQRIPAFKVHPQHGTTVWANHSDVFHTSQAFGEYGYVSKFTGYWTHYILWILLWIATFIRVLLQKPENQAMNALYGDETPIPDTEVAVVRKVIWDNMVIYKWQKGDIVMLDNHRVSHGRLPFTGDRLTICGWGDKPPMPK
jgi:hypothetical protein